MIRKKYLSISSLFFIGSFLFLSAQTIDPITPTIVSPRLAGFGGSYTGLEAGFETLFTNPAALATVNKKRSIAQINAHVAGPISGILELSQAEDMMQGVLDFVGSRSDGLYLGADITGPISFGIVQKNVGFGVFNRTLLSVDVPTIMGMDINAGEETFLTGGFGFDAFSIKNNYFAIGVQFKGFFQTLTGVSGSVLDIMGLLESDNLDIPLALALGYGVDLGFMYRLGNFLNIGVVYRDIFAPVSMRYYNGIDNFLNSTERERESIMLASNLSVGLLCNVPTPQSWPFISSLKLMADYSDILRLLEPFSRNPVLNVQLGTELVLLDVVALRAGIHEGYLAAGIGLDLTYFQIDFAMYGSEQGFEPGARPALNLELGLSFKY